MVKCLLPRSPEHAKSLKQEVETGPGYQVVSVELTDGRFFEQVIVSEGCVIAVRGYTEIPFDAHEIADQTRKSRVGLSGCVVKLLATSRALLSANIKLRVAA